MANHEEEKDSKGHPTWNENMMFLRQQMNKYPDVDWMKAMKGKGKIPYSWLTKKRMKHLFLHMMKDWVDDLCHMESQSSKKILNIYNKVFSDFHCKDVEE